MKIEGKDLVLRHIFLLSASLTVAGFYSYIERKNVVSLSIGPLSVDMELRK